jgi:hypothetical protein
MGRDRKAQFKVLPHSNRQVRSKWEESLQRQSVHRNTEQFKVQGSNFRF